MTHTVAFLAASLALVAGYADVQAQVSVFDSVWVDKKPGVTCYHHRRWVVVQRNKTESVGSDLFIRSARSARCDADSLPGDIVWRNRDADYFLGLRGDILFIDSGTGPDLRGLTVVDLRSGALLLNTDYVGFHDVITGPDPSTVGFWRGYELPNPAPGCPKAEGGLYPGVDSLFWVDVRSGEFRFAGRTRCAERQ